LIKEVNKTLQQQFSGVLAGAALGFLIGMLASQRYVRR